MLITLIDPISNNKYTIDVSIEEARRAERDISFAQHLLDVCKFNENQENSNSNSYDYELDQNQNFSECWSENNSDGGIASNLLNERETHITEPEVDVGGPRRHLWSYNETLKLIASVESHYDELIHANPKTKKSGWENILNDLASSNIIVTIAECKKKWSNLVQSYNKAKDLNKKTGHTPSRFNFFEQIDAILGQKPTNSSPHTIDLGKCVSHTTVLNSSQTFTTEIHRPSDENSDLNQSIVNTPVAQPSTSAASKNTNKRKNVTLDYIKVKKKFFEDKKEEWNVSKLERQKKYEAKEEQFNKKIKLMEKKMELEERKVKAMEEYIALKKSQMD